MEKISPAGKLFKNLLRSEHAPLYLWFSSFPFGIAAQNLTVTVVVLWSAILWYQARDVDTRVAKTSTISWLKHPMARTSTILVLWLLWTSAATWLNPASRVSSLSSYPAGYLTICFAPLFFASVFKKPAPQQWNQMLSYSSILVFLWGLVALSQALFGWRVLGSRFIFESATRPRGFYSHPLSFAYASFLFWPLSVQLFLKNTRDIRAWLMLSGSGLCLLLTQSRTIQAVALITVLCSLWMHFRGWLRGGLISALVLLLLAVFSTSNPLSSKFRETFSPRGVDVHSQYPDDRLAFWHAHWLMVQERPILGHGFRLDTEYRLPYYRELGMENFIKPYEAHNVWLQIWCNSGLAGLVLFIFWVLQNFRLFISSTNGIFFTRTALLTFGGFFLAAFTQNAFQDASVRMVLSMFLAACWLHMAPTHHKKIL